MAALIVDMGRPEDEEAIWAIFTARPEALRPTWRTYPGSSLVVVRDGVEVVAFAILRIDLDQAEFLVDNLECERVDDHATRRGVRALKLFGEWIEARVASYGGGRIISCVGADNRSHEEALKKVGYVDRVHLLDKQIAARGGE